MFKLIFFFIRFLNKKKDEYQQEESRSIDYLYFPLEPSQDDSIFYINEIKDILKKEYKSLLEK